MKTKKERERELKRYRSMQPFIPKRSGFGHDNEGTVAAQIDVIENDLSEDEIEDRYYVDETAEEYCEGDNDVWNEALYARQWLDGDEDESPSQGWEPVVKKNGWKE
jgi:hypothetical protein